MVKTTGNGSFREIEAISRPVGVQSTMSKVSLRMVLRAMVKTVGLGPPREVEALWTKHGGALAFWIWLCPFAFVHALLALTLVSLILDIHPHT